MTEHELLTTDGAQSLLEFPLIETLCSHKLLKILYLGYEKPGIKYISKIIIKQQSKYTMHIARIYNTTWIS